MCLIYYLGAKFYWLVYPTVSTKPSTNSVSFSNQPTIFKNAFACILKVKIVDGSDTENKILLQKMVEEGQIEPLPKMDNW